MRQALQFELRPITLRNDRGAGQQFVLWPTVMQYKTCLAMCAMAHYAIVQDRPYGSCYGKLCCGPRHALQLMVQCAMARDMPCVIAHYAVV